MCTQMMRLCAWVARLLGRRGSISVLSAVTIPVLIGVTGLGVEYSSGLLAAVKDQRAADLAASVLPADLAEYCHGYQLVSRAAPATFAGVC
jgi:uncharacterized membrane protein